MGIGAAIAGVGAAATVGSDIYSGLSSSNAASTASKQQAAGAAQANQVATTQLPIDQGYISAYNNTGTQANSLLSTMMSNPTAFQKQFTASPGYNYELGQQQAAIQNSAAASGGLVGGNTLTALQSNAQGLASQDYQSYINNLLSLQSTGLQAGNAQANLGQNYASTVGNNLIGAANSLSAGTIASNNATNNAVSGATNALGSLASNSSVTGYLASLFGNGSSAFSSTGTQLAGLY